MASEIFVAELMDVPTAMPTLKLNQNKENHFLVEGSAVQLECELVSKEENMRKMD